MKKRLLSGAVYTALLVSVFLIKIFAPAPWGDLGFDALIYFFSLMGTFEIVRAMGDGISKSGKSVVTLFTVVCVPLCVVCEVLWGYGIQCAAACFLLQAAALLSTLVFCPETNDLKSVGAALLCGTYPNAFLCVLLLTNHLAESSALGGSLLAMLFIFVVSPIADVLAFTFGMTLRKKFPKKLAPKASPNKTVIGFIGGLLGGAIAGAGLYFVYHAICGGFENMYIQLPVYVVLGVLISLVTVLGDLVESSIKRHCGVKDMGNIMPGHGGVLDRIDGTMFASVVVYAVFTVCALLGI